MLSLRDRALRCLAQRDHSRQELARKLAAHGSPDEVAVVLQDLKERGLQSDSRFAGGYVRAKARRMGNGRLAKELARRGVDRELIGEALSGPQMEDELQRAREVWRRKFGTPPSDGPEWARQARFLQGRGFAIETIRKLLKDCHDEPA